MLLFLYKRYIKISTSNGVFSSKNLKNNFLFFVSAFIFQFFYLPLVFSNPYLEDEPVEKSITKPSWTCKIDYECLKYLQNELNKESDYSLYQVCQEEYDIVKNCCEGLNNCPSLYGVERDLGNIKSNVLNSSGDQAGCSANSMSSLISSIHGIQKEVCQLGSENCKTRCENKLDELKRRIKSCFSIDSSIDKALEQAKTAQGNSNCYEKLKEVAKKYKRQSLNGRSELKEDLSVQDIVDCKGIKNKANMAVGTKKALGICSQASQELLQRQQEEQAKKEEGERFAREQEKQTELERQKEEELTRKQEKFESRAEMIQVDTGYTENKNAETLNSQDNLQVQSLDTKRQLTESEKIRGSDGETIKIPESEKAKEPADKKKDEKDKESKKEKDKESKEEKKQEDESKKGDEKDKKQDGKNQDDKKKSEDSNKVKDTKQSEGSKIKPVVSAGAVQVASVQTTPALKSPNVESKKTKTVSKAKQSKSDNNLKAVSDKTETSNTKSSKQAQSSEKASISSLAGNTTNINKCPIDMPKIKSAIVYQSVSAPQIEPLDQQEPQKDPNNPNFTSYDLVYRKPAGVLIELGDFKNQRETFHLSLNIKDKAEISKCFLSPLNGQTMHEGDEKDCLFTGYDVFDKHKFIPFPERIGRAGKSTSAIVKLYHKTYSECETIKSFKLNIIKIHPLDLGFTWVSDKRCKNKTKGYKFFVSDPEKHVEDFMESKEVSEYLEAMFPIHKLRTDFVKENNRKFKVLGSCNNSPYKPKISVGVLRDIKKLEKKRKEHDFHKIVAIVPRDYFWFHYNKGWAGLIVTPVWKRFPLLVKWNWRGGSWNIALVREDMKDIGVVSHELGHTLRQGKEFYRQRDQSGKFLLSHKQTKCRKFNGSSKKLCYLYKIKLGLQAGRSNYKNIITGKRPIFWKFIKDKFSIMNNEQGIDRLWIDRDTFQKSFKVLSEREGGVAKMSEDFLDKKSRQMTRPQIVFSGFYDTKKKQVIISDTEVTKTKLKTVSIPKNSGDPIMSFQLKYKNRVIKEVNQPILELEMKLIHKNGTHKKIPNSLSPFLVSFDINKSYANKTFQVNMVNPKTEELILSRTFSIKPKQKKQKEKEAKETDFALLFDSFN